MRVRNKCCICGEYFWGYGNDSYPVKDKGECCNKCNQEEVVPARLRLLRRENRKKENS